jgi:hypothetical protein
MRLRGFVATAAFIACGSSPKPPDAAIPVDAQVIDFGLAPCGGKAAAPKVFKFQNSGEQPLTFNASIDGTKAFSLRGANASGVLAGKVEPGATATITIVPAPITKSATAGQDLVGTLTLTTNTASVPSTQIQLKVTPQGGALKVMGSSVNAADAAFGAVALKKPANAIGLTVTNAGNAAVAFEVGAPGHTEFSVGGAEKRTLDPGATGQLSVGFTPSSTMAIMDTVPLVVDPSTPVCGGVDSIAVSGTGSAAILLADPGNGGSIGFPAVHCGVAPSASRVVSLTNTGNKDFVFKTSLAGNADSPFVVGADTSTVPAGGSAQLRIRTKEGRYDLPGSLTDSLTIAPADGVGAAAITISLSMEVQGARLALTAPGAFDNANAGKSAQTLPIAVVNSGNLPASPSFVISTQSAPWNPFSVVSQTGSLAADHGSGSVSVRFAPPAGDAHAETAALHLVPGPNDVLCGQVPDLALSGTGQGGVIALSTSSFDFGTAGFVPCGSTGAKAQTLTISNQGSTPFDWTAALRSGPASPFTLSPASGTVAGGASATVTVTPLALPFPANTQPNAYGDHLIVTTNLDGDVPHDVLLNQTAQGAILRVTAPATPLDFGGVVSGSTGSALLRLENVGNLPTNVTVSAASTGGLGTFTVNGGPSSVVSALRGAQSVALEFKPGAMDTENSSGSVTVQADPVIPLCAPLPPTSIDVVGAGVASLVSLTPASILTFTGPPGHMGGAVIPAPGPGKTFCGTQAGPQSIAIQNMGSADFTIRSALLGKGAASPFTVTGPEGVPLPQTGRVVSGGEVINLVVTPAPIPDVSTFSAVNAWTDTLTITTSAAGDKPHVITLDQQMWGAQMPIPGTPFTTKGNTVFDFGVVAAGSTASVNMTTSNLGPAPVSISVLGAVGPGFFFPTIMLPASTAPGQSGTATPAGFAATVTPPLNAPKGIFAFQDPPPKGGVTYVFSTVNCGSPGGGGPWATIDARVTVQ